MRRERLVFSTDERVFRGRALHWQPDIVILAEANLWTQFSEKADPAYVIEVKLKGFYQRQRTKFIPVDANQDALFKEQQQKDPSAVFRNAIEQLCSTALWRSRSPKCDRRRNYWATTHRGERLVIAQ